MRTAAPPRSLLSVLISAAICVGLIRLFMGVEASPWVVYAFFAFLMCVVVPLVRHVVHSVF